MGIERGAAASHTTHAAGQRHGAGKTAGQAAASGDFLALMAAAEEGLGALDGDALALPGDARTLGKRGRGDADAEALAIDPAVAGALALPVPLPVADAALRKAGHVAPEAATAAAELAQAGGAAAAPAGAASADPRLAPEYASVFEQLQQHLAARESSAPESALKPAPTAAGASLVPTLQPNDLREARDLKAERGVAALSAAAARTESVTVAAQQDLALVGAERARGGQDAAAGGSGQHGSAHGGWGGAEFTPTVQYDAALGGLDASAALQPDTAFDRQLADQLRHWASQGVRSAELTVGTSEPVQVRIALDGNEAQVQFRAEHAATREMLAGSVDQLRDLLGAQGLVLSGVSVGAHEAGGGRGQAGDGAAAAPAQRPAAARPEAPAEAVAAAPRRAAGALDLYV